MSHKNLSQVALDLYEKIPMLKHFLTVPDNYSETGLSATHIGIMFMLNKRGPMAMKNIADMVYLSRAHVTALVDKLAASGFATRSYPPEDRRVINIEITPEGKAFLAGFRADLLKDLENRLGLLPEEDQTALPEALAQLERILKKMQ